MLFAKQRRNQGLVLMALGVAGVLMYTAAMRQEDDVPALDSPAPSRPAPSVTGAKQEIESRIKEEVSSILDLGSTRKEWNLKDPDFETNGNSDLAVSLLETGTDAPLGGAIDLGAAIKTPWEFYGKIYCAEGIVTFVEDYPPGSEMSEWLGNGTSSQITLMADHGVGSFYMTSGSGDIRVGHYARLCGFPVGRGEVETSAGGYVASAVFIGSGVEAEGGSSDEVASPAHSDPEVPVRSSSSARSGTPEEVAATFPRIRDWVTYLPRTPGCDVQDGACVVTMWEGVLDSFLTPAQARTVRDACSIQEGEATVDWKVAACALGEAERRGFVNEFVEHSAW